MFVLHGGLVHLCQVLFSHACWDDRAGVRVLQELGYCKQGVIFKLTVGIVVELRPKVTVFKHLLHDSAEKFNFLEKSH